VDLILIETMNTLREAVIATKEALKTRLPVLVSFAIGDNGHLLSGESLKEMVKVLEKLKITALLINCFSPTISLKPLKTLVGITKLPVGIYANGIGQPDNAQGWKFTGGKDKEKYISYVKKWKRVGVKIIGGCCGTTPEYIKRISQFRDTGT
jgi:S-methylmethionine-dependent homocysteine/selenocysteine methylase